MSADKDGKVASKGKEIAKVEGDDEEAPSKRGIVRWALGWIVTPGSILGSIFGAGALVGAHTSESWFTRAIVWIVDLF